MKKIVLGIVAVGGLFLSALAEEVELAQIDMSSFDASRFSAGSTANNAPKAYANRGPICAFNQWNPTRAPSSESHILLYRWFFVSVTA